MSYSKRQKYRKEGRELDSKGGRKKEGKRHKERKKKNWQ